MLLRLLCTALLVLSAATAHADAVFPGSASATVCGQSDVVCTSTLDGALLIYNATSGSFVSVDMSGDCTITEAGVLSCTMPISSASDTTIATPANADILVYNSGTGWANVALGGDCTLATDGTITCSATGSAIVLDLGDDAANESAGITEVATTGDTNSIFTEPIADKLLIAVGNNWPACDAATTASAADALSTDPTACNPGDFVTDIAASGTLTCGTPTGSGDVTDVGDCTGGACFTATGTGNSIVFEGATPDAFETTLTAADTTTPNKTITLPNASGTVAVSASSPVTLSAAGDIGCTDAAADATTKGCATYNATRFSAASGVVDIASVAGITGADEDSVSLTDVQTATTSDFHNIGGTDDDIPEAGDYTNLTGGAGIGHAVAGTLTTASGEADFLASGALTCGASTQGKAQVHTTPLQYCDNAATPALQYAAYGDSSGNATGVACAGSCVANAEVDDDITLTNITQITNRAAENLSSSCTDAQVLGGTGASGVECQADADTTYTAGDGITLAGGAFSWNGLEVDSNGTPQGNLLGVDFSGDFSLTKESACVGGSEPGSSCATNADCAGTGTCTASSQHKVSLGAPTYVEGDTILATDLPGVAMRTDTAETITTGVTHTYNSGAIIAMNGTINGSGSLNMSSMATTLPQGTSAANADSGRAYFDTDAVPPMVTMGDGTNTIPIRACQIMTFGPINSANTTYCYGGGCTATATLPMPAAVAISISHLTCNTWYDFGTGDALVFTIQSALASSCAPASNDAINQCSWGNATVTCTVTGDDASATNYTCSDATHEDSIAQGDHFRLEAALSGTPTLKWWGCSALVCIDDAP